MTEQIANSLTDPTATLTAGIAAGDTSLVVSGWASPLPATGTFRIRIGSEIILVGSVSGTTLGGLTRGAESTTAASHASGADVDLVLTAGGLAAYVSENGGSQPGAWQVADFLFSEPGGAHADLVATLPVLAKTTVMDVLMYAEVAPWADDATITVGDGIVADRYFTTVDLKTGLSASFNPAAPSSASLASLIAWSGVLALAPVWQNIAENYPGGGVPYVADDVITMTVTGIATGGGGGKLRVRIIYVSPITPVVAT